MVTAVKQDEPRSEGVPLKVNTKKVRTKKGKMDPLLVRTQRTQINKNCSG